MQSIYMSTYMHINSQKYLQFIYLLSVQIFLGINEHNIYIHMSTYMRTYMGLFVNASLSCIILLFWAHTAIHMLLMLLFDDLFVCIYERTNSTELKRILINSIFDLDDKANDKLLLNVQNRRHLRKKKRNRKKEKRII